ncbi:filamentation induced by cAMP protein Fic [Methanococcus aeolicus Nankai-3]|uniref:Filamentation induced by cAMP protein Fic n=1 Tax=Methanococcus aeolicus (strain ATCC BAA-1280 / DSM 17508 / OCM 812 / Nankai-3) TaxID=419665 RepID=A6UUS6_META3|nr:Fic family protein [Methanococcus aeolicus]ABR56248.1 filamentation induced by cAMP protein Fic [Methanococcus aeolicus Nankai-3]
MKLPEVLEYTKEDEKKALYYYNDEIIGYIKKYNIIEYIHWDNLKYKKGLPIEPKYLWILLNMDRKIHFKELNFHNWTFKYYINGKIQQFLGAFDRLKNIEFSKKINDLINDKYKINAIIEESIASSQIEGAKTTTKMAKEVIKSGKKPKNNDEIMVYNNHVAMKYITNELKNKDFTIDEILKIHDLISKDLIENKYVGEFRTIDDVIVKDIKTNKTLHIPPNHELIEPLINELCNFANNKEDSTHPIIKGIIIHFLIGYIHPFVDGNGRTARALFYWYMLNSRYTIFEYLKVSEFINKSKGKYKNSYLYVESHKCDEYEGDLTYFIGYILDCIEKSINKFNEELKVLENELKHNNIYNNLLNDLKNNNLNLRQLGILEEIIKNPKKKFTIKYIVNSYGVAYATARNDLNIFAEFGILQKKKAGKEFIYVPNIDF